MANDRKTTPTRRDDGFVPKSDNSEWWRAYRQTESYKLQHKKDVKKWMDNNRDKALAHSAIKNRVKSGTIVKPTNCQDCGLAIAVEAHHPDYNKRLEVLWVCDDCHKAIHRKLKFVSNA